jgi:hypothetical protein
VLSSYPVHAHDTIDAGDRRSLEDFKAGLRRVGVIFPADAAVTRTAAAAMVEGSDYSGTQSGASAVKAAAGSVVVDETERLAFICGIASSCSSGGAASWRFAGSAEAAITVCDAVTCSSSSEARRTLNLPEKVQEVAASAGVGAATFSAVAAATASTPGGGLLLDASFLQRIQSFL